MRSDLHVEQYQAVHNLMEPTKPSTRIEGNDEKRKIFDYIWLLTKVKLFSSGIKNYSKFYNSAYIDIQRFFILRQVKGDQVDAYF